MKTYILALAALVMLASCSKDELNNNESDNRATITFRCASPDITITPMAKTRASLADESITDLYVWEGTTLLAHQVSTDTDFGTPTITLDYGTHTITFIASRATGQTWAEGTWSCTATGDTFGKVVSISVTKGMSSEDVSLSRLMSKVKWTIEDAVPSNAKTVTYSATSCYSYDATLSGSNASKKEASADLVTANYIGQTGKTISIGLLPDKCSAETTTTATITFTDASGNVITTYTASVPVLSNRITNIHGKFFGTEPTGTVTLSTDWLDEYDIDL